MSFWLLRLFVPVLSVQIVLGCGMAFASWSPQRRCAFNMKTIEGAIEMYCLDKNAARPTTIEGLLPKLVSQGYLQSVYLCMESCYHYGNTRGGPFLLERWFPSQYRVEIPMTEPLEYRIDKAGSLYCTAHGALEGSRERETRNKPLLPRCEDLIRDTVISISSLRPTTAASIACVMTVIVLVIRLKRDRRKCVP